MDRLSSNVTRNQNVEQPDQEIDNLLLIQNSGQASKPVMSQRKTGRERDEDEKLTGQSQDFPLQSQHSNPNIKSRGKPNQSSFQLEPGEQERFVYTAKQFEESMEKGDIKELVRMLRHGTMPQSEREVDVISVVKKLFNSNKPELLAELIREGGNFGAYFTSTYSAAHSVADLTRLSTFFKAMNDCREIPEVFTGRVLQQWFCNAIKSNNPDAVKVLIQLEEGIFNDAVHGDYIQAIDFAEKKNKKIFEMLIEHMFNDESKLKHKIANSTCSHAAGLAFSKDRLDLAIRLQDAVISREKIMGENDVHGGVKPSKTLIRKSLGTMMSDPNEFKFIEIVVSKLIEFSPNHFEKGGKHYNPSLIQYGNQSRSIDFVSLRAIEQSLVAECIRPDLAEMMAQTGQQAYNQVSDWFNEATGKITDEDYDEDKFISLLASQWGSLVLDDEDVDELTVAQVLMLKNLSNNYIKARLGSIPDLIDQCFDFIDSDLTLDSSDVSDHLMDEFSFPNSLAKFLAEAMDEVITDQVSKPVAALPSGLKVRDVSKYLKKFLKENASREFKNNFSEIIKQQKLITLFNEDAKGREDLWHSYFYAYLDVLKAALPSPKTEQ